MSFVLTMSVPAVPHLLQLKESLACPLQMAKNAKMQPGGVGQGANASDNLHLS